MDVDGNPGLGLMVGSNWRSARYLRGSGWYLRGSSWYLRGSGWYVDAYEFTKSFVAAAVSKFSAVGLEGTVEYFAGSESDFAGLAAAIASTWQASQVEA